MDHVKRLERLMSRLRGKRGCPWDRRQTHQSLKPYLLEEAYEVLEAIESGNPRHLREELGDLLLQVVFHAQLAKERGRFGLQDVARAINEKLLRRHPHVFGDARIRTVGQLKKKWEELKRVEKPHRKTIFDGLPKTLPALLRAQRLHEKLTRKERPYSDTRLEKGLQKAWTAWKKASRSRKKKALETAAGDFLFAFARLCQSRGIHSEMVLRTALRRFERSLR